MNEDVKNRVINFLMDGENYHLSDRQIAIEILENFNVMFEELPEIIRTYRFKSKWGGFIERLEVKSGPDFVEVRILATSLSKEKWLDIVHNMILEKPSSKIPPILLLRNVFGLSLKEAKDYVDSYRAEMIA